MADLDLEGPNCYVPSASAPVSQSKIIEVSETVLVVDSHFPRTQKRGAAQRYSDVYDS